jgi:hypothetical protein
VRKQGLKICVVLVLVLLLANAFVPGPAPAFATGLPAPADSSPTPPPAQPSAAQLEDWRTAMAQVPLPKQGCFTTTYPATQWKEFPCTTPPNIPMPPKRQPRPLIIGNGSDISARAPSGFISTAIGSFDAGTIVTGEAGQIGNSGAQVANAYTLQINTDFFVSADCAGSPNPSCRGWEQFVYQNDGASGFHGAYIQYWLIQYNTTCPGGWTQFSFSGSTTIYCFRNSPGSASPPSQQPATNLNNLSLTGNVTAGSDNVIFGVGGTMYATPGSNSVHASAGWTIAEFNVFGDGGNSSGGGQANFSAGTTLKPRTRIIYGGTNPPNCVAQGFTGETNNLSMQPIAPAKTPPGPAVLFTLINTTGPTSCSYAQTVGDTHLGTFNGLLYDFQASGDFILAQAPDFVVHARQVSGAPTWPDASVNQAVATLMDNNTFAICPAIEGPPVTYINGDLSQLADNQPISLDGGVDIWKQGNVYTVLDQAGNSMRAAIHENPLYINVSVGLGTDAEQITGLLANANNNVLQIAARDGTVLTAPFVFGELYGPYGTGWRVPPLQDTLLAVCGSSTENSIPSRPLYAKDLDLRLSAPARAICEEAGVNDPALLDACTLDVVVLDTPDAATVYAGAPAPIAVGQVFIPTIYLPLVTR